MTSNAISTAAIVEEVPWSDGITSYDEVHFAMYLRILDATAEGASQEDMARTILGIDPLTDPDRARRALASHLRRARWMTEHGYRRLIGH